MDTRLNIAEAPTAIVLAATIACAMGWAAEAADAREPCAGAATDDLGRCEGFWNIYASIPGGDTWWFKNKFRTDPRLNAFDAAIDRKTERIQQRLRACGVASYVSLSDWLSKFRPDLIVVTSRVHATAGGAAAELAKARACGIAGYTKFSDVQVAGND